MNADKSKVSQVLRNFISNALKFTPKGGIVRVVHKFLPLSPDSLEVNNRERTLSGIRSSSLTSGVRDIIRSRINSSAVYVSNVDVDEGHDHDHDHDHGENENFVSGILRIEVHDTGCGINQENQQKLFKSIVQFDTAVLQSGKGSGLGLWSKFSIHYY